MRKKHKPPHAGTAVMFAATLVVILLISQDRNNKVLRLEAEIRQEVESRSAQARQEALAGSIQVLQYRYIKDCPLPKKVQREIFHICEDNSLSFELVMSLICEESGWDSECISDNGESVGLMQIQKRWHAELMDKTGCTDLT
ncbi:MAG: lytic transglycosylase domain-containing protein, partial [Eubacterium sp.]|nr:lytic transglycosylase domain-containing protein [Eubacterium sp.]